MGFLKKTKVIYFSLTLAFFYDNLKNLMKKRINIGIIGFGNMGSAIAARFADNGYEIYVFDKDKNKLQGKSYVKAVVRLPELLNNSGIVILAVKPQNLFALLKEIKLNKNLANKIIVSIAAGVPTAIIEEILGAVRVIRVMPNLFAATGNGVCGICKGKHVTEEDLSTVKNLLKCLGQTIQVSEDRMDAVTAISGSGPGYLCYLVKDDDPSKRIGHLNNLIPAYEKAAAACGFSPDEIKIVATVTASSVALYLKEHPEDNAPEDFCNKVTSEGGTTEAVINVLKEKGEGAMGEAVKAGVVKSKEIEAQAKIEIKEGEE